MQKFTFLRRFDVLRVFSDGEATERRQPVMLLDGAE